MNARYISPVFWLSGIRLEEIHVRFVSIAGINPSLHVGFQKVNKEAFIMFTLWYLDVDKQQNYVLVCLGTTLSDHA